MDITTNDRGILRDLARRVAEIAAEPIQAERRELWVRHNSLRKARPMILLFPEGSWREIDATIPVECESDDARGIEGTLRRRLYHHEHFADDTVIENTWTVGKHIRSTGWGLAGRRIDSDQPTGAWRFDPVIKEPADLGKLRFPEITHDEAASAANLDGAEELFGDIFDVRQKGVAGVSYHLMNQYTRLRGLAEVMMDMIAEPQMLHDAMAFFTEGHQRVLRQYIERNLLSLNNDGTYQNSGGNGYTDQLPGEEFDPDRVRPIDMWASAEAQEMAQVSPEMHAEFVTAYEKKLLAPFGLTGYGCCEDLTRKLPDVLTIPGIRRISISPWADVDACAEQLGGGCIFSWKPKPTMLVGTFDEDRIRAYIRHTLDAAARHGCVLEMILKDTHTCEHHPERFDRWTQIAREEVERG